MWHVSALRILISCAFAAALSGCNLTLIAPPDASSAEAAGSGGSAANEPPISLSVSPAYPSHGANWMDYVKNDGADVYSGTDTACAGTEPDYSDCIHGGELRIVPITGVSSCAGLALSDSLGVFNWGCTVVGGVATFRTTGFRSGKGLKDLVNASSWKTLSVTLSGARAGSSSAAAWWSNPVSPLPDNSGAADPVIDLDGTTYPPGSIMTLAASRETYGYNVIADRIAVVTLGSAVLSYNGNAATNCNGGDHCIIMGGATFDWYEGTLNGIAGAGTNADHGFYSGATFSRFHDLRIVNMSNCGFYFTQPASQITMTNVTIEGAGNVSLYTNPVSGPVSHSYLENTVTKDGSNGIWLQTGGNNLVRGVRSSNMSGLALILDTEVNDRIYDVMSFKGEILVTGASTGNLFNRVQISNGGNENIRIESSMNGTPSGNSFVQVVIQGAQYGITMTGATENVFAQVTAANHYDEGLKLIDASDRNTFHQFASVNNKWGVFFDGAGASAQNTFSQFAALDSLDYGIHMDGLSDNSKFTGAFLVGGSGTADCQQTGGTNPGLVDGTCTQTGTDGSNDYGATDLSDATLRPGRSSALSFVGKLTAADPANASVENTGGASYPTDPTTFDWLSFSNPFRLWGLDGSAYPNADQADLWIVGLGRIWDWELVASDPVLLNRSGDGASSNGAFVAGAACPAAAGGNAVATDQASSPRTYLLSAIEIVDPLATGYASSGNHDGLCESGEHCVYAPNFGAYQGHGSLATCAFQDGTVSNVTLYGYSSDGI